MKFLEKIIGNFILSEDTKTRLDKAEKAKNRITLLTKRIEQQMVDYDSLLNGIDTMVWLTYDPERQGKANEAFLKFFNVKQEDIEGKHLNEILSPEEASDCISINKTVFKTGTPITTYEWVTRYDGEKRLLKITKKLKKNGETYIVASADDITELEKTRNKLETENIFSNSVIDTAHALIIVLDTEANIVKCNKYFEEITGYSSKEILGKNWFNIFIKESDKKSIRNIFQKHLDSEDEGKKSVINPIKTKEGSEILVEWFSRPLINNFQITIGLVGVGQDVSKRIKIEQELWTRIIDLELQLKEAQIKKISKEKYQQHNRQFRGNGEKIIVLEDEEVLLKMLSKFLNCNGYTVFTALNSQEALKILESEEKIDFLVVDFYLKNDTMNGKQFIDHIIDLGLDIPYLIISGVDPKNFMDVPLDNFLQKPFALFSFLKKIYTLKELNYECT